MPPPVCAAPALLFCRQPAPGWLPADAIANAVTLGVSAACLRLKLVKSLP